MIAGVGPVLADIAAQVAADQHANPPSKWSEVDEHGRLSDHAHPHHRRQLTWLSANHLRRGMSR
jgi:hypothetical protein